MLLIFRSLVGDKGFGSVLKKCLIFKRLVENNTFDSVLKEMIDF